MYSQDEIDAYMGSLQGKYKPDEIAAYKNHLETNFGPKAPGGAPETAVPGDVYTHGERLASSFGNEAGNAEVLKAKGNREVRLNPRGEPMVRDATGKWVYEPRNVLPTDWAHPLDTSHPLNAAESAVGEALPLAGMVGGGVATKSIPGAVAGAYTLEGLRQQIGKRLGVYSGGPETQVYDAAHEGGKALVAEAGGKAINQIPVGKYLPKIFADQTLGDVFKTGTDYWMDKARKALATTASGATLGRVPVRSTERMLARPSEVMSMTESHRPGEPSGVVQNIAEQASKELEDRLQSSGQNVGSANKEFMEKFGAEPVPTYGMLNRSNSFLDEIPINENGTGKMDPRQINDLKDWANREFTTEQTTSTYPGAEYNPKPIKGPDKIIPYTPVEFKPDFAKGVKVEPGPERNITVPGETVGYQSNVPVKTFDSLKSTADGLQADTKNWWDRNPLSKSAPIDVNYKEVLYRRIKDMMHDYDPNLAGADASYAQLKDDAKLLRSLDTPGRGEGFISNLMGRNKTEIRDAAARQIPDTFHGPVKDLQAARDFEQGGVTRGAWPTAAQTLRATLAGAAGYGAHNYGMDTADALALTAATGLVTDPTMWKLGLHYSSRVSDPFTSAIRRSGGSQIAPAALKQYSPWSLFEERNQ